MNKLLSLFLLGSVIVLAAATTGRTRNTDTESISCANRRTTDNSSCREWTRADGCERDERIRTEYCPCACARKLNRNRNSNNNDNGGGQREIETVHVIGQTDSNFQPERRFPDAQRRNEHQRQRMPRIPEGWILTHACIDSSAPEIDRMNEHLSFTDSLVECIAKCDGILKSKCKSVEYRPSDRRCKNSAYTPWNSVSTPCNTDRPESREITVMGLKYGTRTTIVTRDRVPDCGSSADPCDNRNRVVETKNVIG